VAYEYLWINAWVESIETAKAGLQATLIIRHPDDDKLYVNFDAEILQLIREAKCLERLGVPIPESARIVLLQENKFKAYYAELSQLLREYARISGRVIPVTAGLLRPALHDLEYRLRPGMLTLTWTSMNISVFTEHVKLGLERLDDGGQIAPCAAHTVYRERACDEQEPQRLGRLAGRGLFLHGGGCAEGLETVSLLLRRRLQRNEATAAAVASRCAVEGSGAGLP
jgi:hypothetical protein